MIINERRNKKKLNWIVNNIEKSDPIKSIPNKTKQKSRKGFLFQLEKTVWNCSTIDQPETIDSFQYKSKMTHSDHQIWWRKISWTTIIEWWNEINPLFFHFFTLQEYIVEMMSNKTLENIMKKKRRRKLNYYHKRIWFGKNGIEFYFRKKMIRCCFFVVVAADSIAYFIQRFHPRWMKWNFLYWNMEKFQCWMMMMMK